MNRKEIEMTTRSPIVSQFCLLTLWVICFYALPATCEAQVVVAESPTNVLGQAANRTVIWGQTFTTLGGGYLDTISVRASKYGIFTLPPTVRLNFYRVRAGTVVIPPVFSTAVSTTPLGSGTAAWLNFSIPNHQFAVIDSQQYAFSMNYDTQNNQLVAFLISTNYTGGTMLRGDGQTFIADSGGSDLIFRVSATPPSLTIYPAVEIAFATVSNQNYQVQYSTNLGQTSWTDFGASLLGDGTVRSVFDSTRQTSARSYRLLLRD